MGVIFSEHDARRIRKCVHAFERSGAGGRAEKRRHFNYDDSRSVRYLIGVSSIGPGASAAVAITGETVAATGGIFTTSSGEAIIGPIGRYLAGYMVGFGVSGSKTEVVPLVVDFQQYASGLASWATVDTARGYYLGYLIGSDQTVTLAGGCVFETTEANQHIRVYATNNGAADTVNPNNYSHFWLTAMND